MAGKTPHEAVDNFVAPIKRSLHTLIPSQRCHHSHDGGVFLGSERTLTFHGGQPMWTATGGQEPRRYGLVATMSYRIIEDRRPGYGPYRVTMLEYIYDIVVPRPNDPAGETMLAWHWHPNNERIKEPHLHIKPGAAEKLHPALCDAHVPTGRVALEDVVEFMHAELRVVGQRHDWEPILNKARDDHLLHRSWHHRSPHDA